MPSVKEINKQTWRGVAKRPKIRDVKRLMRMMGHPVKGTNSAVSHRFERSVRYDQVILNEEGTWVLSPEVPIVDPGPFDDIEDSDDQKRPAKRKSEVDSRSGGEDDVFQIEKCLTSEEKPKKKAKKSSSEKSSEKKSPGSKKERGPRRRARVRCGECVACQCDDCGVCEQCVRKVS